MSVFCDSFERFFGFIELEGFVAESRGHASRAVSNDFAWNVTFMGVNEQSAHIVFFQLLISLNYQIRSELISRHLNPRIIDLPSEPLQTLLRHEMDSHVA